MNFNDLLDMLNALAWGPVTIALLVSTGVYLSFRLGFAQLRLFWHGIKCVAGKYDDPTETGDISHFKALAAALAATIGTGNIAGVATAIGLGPGSTATRLQPALLMGR